jgi:hypothetical protein
MKTKRSSTVNPWRIKKFKNWQAMQDWLAVNGNDYQWRQVFINNATALEIRKLKTL